jgi:hypothetical protein
VGIEGQTVLLRPSTVTIDTAVEAAPGVDERVLAMAEGVDGPVALVQTPTDVRLVVFAEAALKPPWPVADVLDGDLIGEAPVVLHRDGEQCAVLWVESGAAVDLGVDCVSGSSLTAIDGDTVVVSLADAGVHRVTAEGATEIASGGLLVDWDGASRLFAASIAENSIVVMNVDGVVERVIPADGPLLAMTALGASGVVWAEVSGEDTRVRWASPEGDDLGEVVHSQAIVTLTGSPDGAKLGVERRFDVATYEMVR